MKYDTFNDFRYFIMGASIASGRIFWVGEDGDSNKRINKEETETLTSISKDGKVGRINIERKKPI